MSKIACLAVLAISVWLASPAMAAPMFSDVPPTHWAYDAVRMLVEKGIIEGYPAEPRAAPRPAAAPRGKARPKRPRRALPHGGNR